MVHVSDTGRVKHGLTGLPPICFQMAATISCPRSLAALLRTILVKRPQRMGMWRAFFEQGNGRLRRVSTSPPKYHIVRLKRPPGRRLVSVAHWYGLAVNGNLWSMMFSLVFICFSPELHVGY